jgi:hypothetical protein
VERDRLDCGGRARRGRRPYLTALDRIRLLCSRSCCRSLLVARTGDGIGATIAGLTITATHAATGQTCIVASG